MKRFNDLRFTRTVTLGMTAVLSVAFASSAFAQDPGDGNTERTDVRRDLLYIVDAYSDILSTYQLDSGLAARLHSAGQDVAALNDEEFSMAGALAPLLKQMRENIELLRSRLSLPAETRTIQSSAGFPQAEYPDINAFDFLLSPAGSAPGLDIGQFILDVLDLLFNGVVIEAKTILLICEGDPDGDGVPNRAPDEVVLISQNVVAAAEAVKEIASRICEQVAALSVVGEGGGGNLSILCIVTDLIFVGVKTVHENLVFCEGAIDTAEIAASYQRLEHMHDDWTCKFPGDVALLDLRSGHGCNGIDEDCDGEIDDCGEDIFGPVIFIDHSVTKCCYDDVAEAAAAVALGVKAWDDCGDITVHPPIVNGTECDVTVLVTATDECSNNSSATTTVTIDGDGPSVTIDPAVADVCYASIDAAEQAVLDATTIDDNCDALEDLEITVHSSVTECALRVRLEVTDKCGNTTVAAITVRVDPHIPTVDIQVLRLGFRGEVLGFQTPVCYETIAQAEQAVLAVTYAEDNCTVSKELVTSVSSAGDPCSLLVTSKAVDECGNENTDSETVRVDAEAPVVTCAVETSSMSPPNHTMRNVGFTFTATDNCTGEPEIEIFITSDETTASADGAGQASPAPDAFILRDLDGVFQGILLRAERSTRGDGRVYEITVRATDACGNVGECSANVSVSPAGNQPATDSGQYYDATAVN